MTMLVSGRGRAHTPIARELAADPTWRREEAPSLGVQEQKEEIVNYAIRFLFGDVPRLRTGAVFLAVAALGIFVSGCNRGQATTATPVPEVEVATAETRDVPVYHEWVTTLDASANAQIRPQLSGSTIRQNNKNTSLLHI